MILNFWAYFIIYTSFNLFLKDKLENPYALLKKNAIFLNFKEREKIIINNLDKRNFEIFYYIKEGDLQKIKNILSNNNINQKGPFGFTPLLFSIYCEKPEIAEFLIQKGADVGDFSNQFDIDAISISAFKGYNNLFKIILKKLKEKNKPFNITRTLNFAIGNENKEIIKIILEEIKNNRDEFYEIYPLHFAILLGKEEIADYLIANGFDINFNKNDYHWNGLHYAVFSGNKEMVRYTISRGANINEIDIKGRTPLHIAAIFEKKTLFKILLSKGANKEIKDYKNMKPEDYFKIKKIKCLWLLKKIFVLLNAAVLEKQWH